MGKKRLSFRQSIELLEKREKRIKDIHWQLENIRSRWENLLYDIKYNYPSEWEKYCNDNHKVTDYDFSDLLA